MINDYAAIPVTIRKKSKLERIFLKLNLRRNIRGSIIKHSKFIKRAFLVKSKLEIMIV